MNFYYDKMADDKNDKFKLISSSFKSRFKTEVYRNKKEEELNLKNLSKLLLLVY